MSAKYPIPNNIVYKLLSIKTGVPYKRWLVQQLRELDSAFQPSHFLGQQKGLTFTSHVITQNIKEMYTQGLKFILIIFTASSRTSISESGF